jgi:hypothetical protein
MAAQTHDRTVRHPPSQTGPRSGPRTALDDPGSAQAALLAGWIPVGVAAVVSGVLVGIATSSFGTVVLAAVGGTVIGYVVCLICAFGLGFPLSKRELSPMAADRVFSALFLSGAPAAVAVAVLVWLARRAPW